MNLSDYQWSRNPRGMHDPGDNHQRWQEWGLGWVKLVYEVNDPQHLRWAQFALENNVTPILRVYRNQFSGLPMDDEMRRMHQDFLNVGVKWHEFYNEPNIIYEWPNQDSVDLRASNIDLIRPLCDNWLAWAEFIIANGGYPASISLTETIESWGETTQWIVAICQYLFDNHYSRFLNVLNNGFWIASHPYIVNHWYQYGTGPLSPRIPPNGTEGGWYFEYPYDPICQADDPGRTVWGGTPKQPQNDVFGVLGSGIAWLETLQQMFGVGWVPVVGTEGGIWRIPYDYDGQTYQQDPRYPAYNLQDHGHGTLAMFNWIADQAPPWMFGIALWRLNDYWRNGNPIPALQLMASHAPRLKNNIPPIPAIGDAPPPYDANLAEQVAELPEAPPPAEPVEQAPPVVVQPTLLPPGPGPVHSNPTYHFVLVGNGFDKNWVIDSPSVRNYWSLYQPVLLDNMEFINFLPYETSLALTLISLPELADSFREQIWGRWPTVWIDMVIAGDSLTLDDIFRVRVENGARF